MPPSRKRSCTLLDLPPEILVPIVVNVAIYSPKTFFSLGLVCLELKEFLTDYRYLIVKDIGKHINTGTFEWCFFMDRISKPEVLPLLPKRFHEFVPPYVRYINKKLPKELPNDPETLRRTHFFLEWIIDIVALPSWLPLAVKLPQPIMAKMMETIDSDSDYDVDFDANLKYFILPPVYACEPGDLGNVNVYESISSDEMFLAEIPWCHFPIFMQHLVNIRLKYGNDMYMAQLKRMSSAGLWFDTDAITSIPRWYDLDYDYHGEDIFRQTAISVCTRWHILDTKDSTSKKLIEHEIQIDSVLFWQAFHDQLILGEDSAKGRQLSHEEFFQQLFILCCRSRLHSRMFDYCLENYPGGVTREVIERGLRLSLPHHEFFYYLALRGYDRFLLVDIILSMATDANQTWLFNTLGFTLDNFPDLKELFYQQIMTREPFIMGYYVYENVFDGYRSIPFSYQWAAVERFEVDTLELLISPKNLHFAEDILRKCIFLNKPASFISWYLDHMEFGGFLWPQFVEDMEELARSLDLEDIGEELCRFKTSPGNSSMFIGKNQFKLKGNRLITDYYKPIIKHM